MSRLDDSGPRAEIRVESIAHGGDGVGHLPDGRVVFVDGGFPGDVVRAELVNNRKRFARGRTEEVLEIGVPRLQEHCPDAHRCGGCRFQQVSAELELRWKVDATRQVLERIGRSQSWPEPVVLPAPRATGYRHRVRLRVLPDGRTGYLQARSHEVVAVLHCNVLIESIEACRHALGPVLEALSPVEELFLEANENGASVGALIRTVRRPAESALARARALLDAMEDEALSTVVLNLKRESDFRGPHILFGDGFMDRSYPSARGTVTVREPVGGFSQANVELNALLRHEVVRRVQRAGDAPTVLELFSGSGNLTGAMLEVGATVHAMEGEEAAVYAARDAFAGQAHESTVCDLRGPLPSSVGAVSPDVVVADPPRSGMSKDLLRSISQRETSHLVYVACDPAALARDADRLAEGGWRVVDWTVLDMFPRTPHVEIVAAMRR